MPRRELTGARMQIWIRRLAEGTALVGGAVIIAMIGMTVASIVGRVLQPVGLARLPGDIELVEAGIVIAVFCFLPLGQYRAAHATVDIFTSGLGRTGARILVAVWELVFVVVLVLILWRLHAGMVSMRANGSITMFLQFPVWWVFWLSLAPAAVTVVVGVWSAADRLLAVYRGSDSRAIGPAEA